MRTELRTDYKILCLMHVLSSAYLKINQVPNFLCHCWEWRIIETNLTSWNKFFTKNDQINTAITEHELSTTNWQHNQLAWELNWWLHFSQAFLVKYMERYWLMLGNCDWMVLAYDDTMMYILVLIVYNCVSAWWRHCDNKASLN